MPAPRYPGATFLGKATHDSGRFAKGYPIGILQHYTAGGSGKADAKTLNGRNPRKVSVHFTIDRDGTVYQCAELDQCCHHAGHSSWKGLSSLNYYWIGIENANYGYWRPGLSQVPTTASALAKGWQWLQHKRETSNRLWESYPKKQVDENLKVCRWLLEKFPTIIYIEGHDDVSPGRKPDPGPAFPMQFFDDLIRPDSESGPVMLTVKASTPLNIRGGPGVAFDTLDWGPLRNGSKVKVIREDGDWSFVEVAIGKQGWVFSTYIV